MNVHVHTLVAVLMGVRRAILMRVDVRMSAAT